MVDLWSVIYFLKGGVVMTQKKKKIIIIASIVVVALIVGAIMPFVLPWAYRDQAPRAGAETPDADLSSFFLTYGFNEGWMCVKKGGIGSRFKVADLYFGLPVTYIGEGAFKDKAKLENVALPGGLMGIDNEAFSGCSSLKNLYIPAGLNFIGRNAFNNCTSMTSITLPGDIEISNYAFNGCTALESVTIGEGEAVIASNAFKGCTSLTRLSIPSDIKSIDANAFAGCTNLVFSVYDNALYLGNSENPYVALITVVDQSISSCKVHPDTKIFADEAFADCFLLETINYDGTMEQWSKISLPFSWDFGAGDYTIYCTDGEI